MMSVKKKSRLWPIWGCLCSVAWATCSGIIRLSLKISSGSFWVVSLVPWLIRESSVAGFGGVCEGWEFPRGRGAESPVATAAEDWGWDPGVGGWLHGDTRIAGKEGWILPPWELLWRRLGRPRPGAAEQEEPRERQQLPLTKITPFCGSFSSSRAVPGVTLGDVLW